MLLKDINVAMVTDAVLWRSSTPLPASPSMRASSAAGYVEAGRREVRAEMTDINDSPEELEELEDLEAEEADAQNVKGGAAQDSEPLGRGGRG
jgi:hypothetical protein